jgi:site-specific recombinase XerD
LGQGGVLSADQVQSVAEAIRFYELVGMPSRSLAQNTRVAYRTDLGMLEGFLGTRGIDRIHDVKLLDLDVFLAELDAEGYSPASRERYVYCLKAFFRSLKRYGVIPENPALELRPPRVPRREPRYLTKDEYGRLLRVCSHHPRDAAVIELLLQTGMRVGECARLKVGDIDLPTRISKEPDAVGTVRVKRKGGKTDSIPLNYKACQALAAWLRARPTTDSRTLFLTKYRNPLSRRSIQELVVRYLVDAGIRSASAHTLRHTHATHHLIAGTDLRTIQANLGHAHISTTALYLALAKKEQRKAMQENAL